MGSFEKLLIRARILDLDGTLSLTSLTLLVMLFRVASCKEVSMAELGAFLAAVANYAGKKLIHTSAASSETSETVADLATQVASLKTDVAVLNNRTNPLNGRR